MTKQRHNHYLLALKHSLLKCLDARAHCGSVLTEISITLNHCMLSAYPHFLLSDFRIRINDNLLSKFMAAHLSQFYHHA